MRGERLGISRSVFVTDAGDDNSSLAVFEIDARDRLLSVTQFDHDALDAAIEELDARYVVGEGAEHAQVVATNAAFFRALNAFDFDAMRELAGPGFVYVDRRLLGTPPLDVDAFIEWQEGYRGVENHAVVVDIQIRGRVDLVTAVNHAVDADGGEILWPYLFVGVVDADGRAVRVEAFAPEDREAALARFDELSRGSTAPAVENAASRVWAEVLEASEAGADDVLEESRRAGVPPRRSHAGHRNRAGRPRRRRRRARDVTGAATSATSATEVVAIRGDRCRALPEWYARTPAR